MNDLVAHWKDRWFEMRKKNDLAVQRVREFTPNDFSIEKSRLEFDGP
jgi:hypothetical protein